VRTRRFVDLEGHDAYELIGVTSSASAQEIQRAYRRTMLTAHPDRGGSEHQAKLINCARDALLRDRAAYDKFRDRLAQRAAANGGGDAGYPDEDEAVPQPASAEDRSADDDWADEDWDEDPWEDSEEGVGAPGQGADSPGAAGDDYEDDQPYRPYQPLGAPSLWDRLGTPPVLLLGALVLGLIVAISLQGGTSSTSTFPATRITNPIIWPLPTPTGYLADAYRPENLLPSGTYPTLSRPLSSYLADRLIDLLPLAHTCKIRADDRLWCSGGNSNGQLGVGDTKQHSKAKQVQGGHRWRAVALGYYHTCAIRSDRSLWCWGSNAEGELGIGKGKRSTAPRRVAGGRQWLSIATIGTLNCAVSTGHTLWCWGATHAAVSRTVAPPPPDSRTPKRYGKGITWQKVYADDNRLCAHRPGRRDICWSVYDTAKPP
jgi:hypothetical protein